MIQRIQSIYLLLAVVALVVVNFFPMAVFGVEGGSYTMTITGVEANGVAAFAGNTLCCYGLPVCSGLAALLALVALFGYRNRVRQMSLCVYGILAVLAFYVFYGVQAWLVYSAAKAMPEPSLTAQLPLISIILFILAGRAIKRDENLVRSMDRIR